MVRDVCGLAIQEVNRTDYNLKHLAVLSACILPLACGECAAYTNLAALVGVVFEKLCLLIPSDNRYEIGLILGKGSLYGKIECYNGLSVGCLLQFRFLAKVANNIDLVHNIYSLILNFLLNIWQI